MIKKSLLMMVICLLAFGTNINFIAAQTKIDRNLSSDEKVKANVLKRGTGEKSKVVVKMKDGTKRKGYISQTGENSFDLTDSKTKQTGSLAYSDVAQVKGTGLSTAAKIAIGVGIGVAVSAIVVGIAVRGALDDFCPLGCGP